MLSCEGFHATALILTTVKIGIDSSPPGRVQPAPPTGTQGERNVQHGIGVPSPFVGRPESSGELVSTPQKSDHPYTTMASLPGSSGDSAVHRESLEEDVKIKTEPGIKSSESEGSPQKREMKGSSGYQSFGRVSDNKEMKEEGRSLDLEDESPPPPEVPSGTKVGRDAKHDSQREKPSVKNEQDPSKTTLVMSKNKECKVAKTKNAASELDQLDCTMKVEYRPFKFIKEEETTEG